MTDRIVKIIKQIIFPKYPEIIDVEVSVAKQIFDETYYIVEYIVNGDVSRKLEKEVLAETRSLLRMLQIDKGMVHFEVKPE